MTTHMSDFSTVISLEVSSGPPFSPTSLSSSPLPPSTATAIDRSTQPAFVSLSAMYGQTSVPLPPPAPQPLRRSTACHDFTTLLRSTPSQQLPIPVSSSIPASLPEGTPAPTPLIERRLRVEDTRDPITAWIDSVLQESGSAVPLIGFEKE